MKTISRNMRQAGVSAVEMLVSLVLGVIVVGGASTIYIASKTSYIEVEQNSLLTENSLFTERFLSDAVRHVGFLGEVQAGRIEMDDDLSPVAGDCSGTAAAYAVDDYLVAAVADAAGNAFGCIADAVPGSHVLVVKSVVPQPLSDGPRRSLDPDDRDGVIDTPRGLVAGETYIMTNDMVGVLFDGADTPPTIGVGGEVPGGVAWVYRFEVLYIRSGGTPQLSRKTLRNIAGTTTLITEDLVLGVEDMRLRVGMDAEPGNEGNVDTYRDVSAIGGDWDLVQSMEISLLLRSPSDDKGYSNTKTYKMSGSDVTRNDHYRRVMISTSVSLRNPKLVIKGGAV
ncbi:MAG: type IV pilus assembly protein PilW [Bacteroidia bacterium]|jgi:type IV pilus assembly protein PilW